MSEETPDADEVRLINSYKAQIRMGLVMYEVTFPVVNANRQRAPGKYDDGAPASSPRQPPEEQEPTEGAMPQPSQRSPKRRARPPIEPGVMAFVHLGPGGVAVPSSAQEPGTGDLLRSRNYLEAMVSIEDLTLPEHDLRRRLTRFRNRGFFLLGIPIVLDVRLYATPGNPVKLPDFGRILRDPSYCISAFRLIQIPDKT